MTQPPTGPWGPPPLRPPGPEQGHPGPGPGLPPPQWNSSPSWPEPAPAPGKNGRWKWVAACGVLLAVAAISVTATILWDRHASTDTSASHAASSGIASADDTSPVGIITDDPSCAAWAPVASTLSTVEDKGWKRRDPNVPASSWAPDIQAQYRAVADAMRSAADQAVPLAKVTPHRVMRELYGAFIAYHRAYADRVPGYVPADNALALVASNAAGIINGVCGAIPSGAAAARTVLVPVAEGPNTTAPPDNPAQIEKFMPTPIAQCTDWKTAMESANDDPTFAAWLKIDPSIPAGSWSPEAKASNDAVKPIISTYADTMERLGRQSPPVVEDFAVLGAQYARAFVQAIPTYTQADAPLYDVERLTVPLVTAACRAVT